jgi:hypothetical protein
MARIVTYALRYRPPRKRRAVALEGSAIVRAARQAGIDLATG